MLNFRNQHDLPTPPARFSQADGARVGPMFRKYFTTETGGWEEQDIDVVCHPVAFRGGNFPC